MIKLTGLNSKEMILNEELIEKIESVPESVITLNNGKKYLVLDSVEEILSKIVEYKRKTRVPYVEEGNR
ncbi:MAG: flagellar FlbD family protein [Clostridiaceae bacterium]